MVLSFGEAMIIYSAQRQAVVGPWVDSQIANGNFLNKPTRRPMSSRKY